jgi:hypothetical protein
MGAERTVQTQQSEVFQGLPHSQGAKTSQWLMSRSAAQLSPSTLYVQALPGVGRRNAQRLGLEKRKVTGERTTEWDVVIAQTRTAICSWARQVLLGRWSN